jgi:hypothetical protein
METKRTLTAGLTLLVVGILSRMWGTGALIALGEYLGESGRLGFAVLDTFGQVVATGALPLGAALIAAAVVMAKMDRDRVSSA